jgi:hypothetical protein
LKKKQKKKKTKKNRKERKKIRKKRKEKYKGRKKQKTKKKQNLPLEQPLTAAEGYKYLPCKGSNVTTAVAGKAESVVAVAAERSRIRPPVLAGTLSHELVI